MTDRPSDILEFKRGPVVSERHGSTLVLRLNRPERLNAVNAPLYELLERFVEDSMAEEGVRCVVITGQGRAFCAGADLKAHSGDGPPAGPELERYIHLGQRVNRLLQICPKPVVAAVNGPAVGAGLELALSADFMVVADDAKLRFPELSLGTFVGGGAVYTIAERVGVAKARELIYLGDFFSGADAFAMGLAYRSAPAAEVLECALALADRLAGLAPLSFAWAKELIGPAGGAHRGDALAGESVALGEIMDSSDWREGMRAFMEGRPPEFTGE